MARGEAAIPLEAVAPVAIVQRTALGERWSDVIRPLIASGSIVALLRELALQAELVGIDQGDEPPVWRLRVERESLRVDSLRDKLQAAVGAALGAPVRLVIEAGAVQDTIARRDTEAREAAQRDAEQLIRSDPAVRELMAQFSTARIVPGSIKPIAEPTRTDTP
jgi:DNA polymerase-3 subunit gamma/tau